MSCKSTHNTSSNITVCNNDLLYLADHCYNVIGDEKLKSITDRILLSALDSSDLNVLPV